MSDHFTIEFTASRVVRALRWRSAPDRRFRNRMAIQMQEIYLAVYRDMGLRLKAKQLARLWKEQCADDYRRAELYHERRMLLQRQLDLARRIKEINNQIRDYEEP